MPTPPIEAAWTPGSFEPPPLRFRAELPSLPHIPLDTALHDFLVPVLWPELSPQPAPQAERSEHRRCLDPDSMFWSPASHGGDVA